MKPPRKEAITKALAILIESLNDENGSQLLPQDTAALDSNTQRALSDAEEALNLTKSCIIGDIDRLASDIRRRRNVAAPIHQLPPEVFITIISHLSDAYWIEGQERRILDLMTVNRIWREIIISSPQLWTTLRSNYPPEFAKLVIERSKAHPLSLLWDTSASHFLDAGCEEFEHILKLVTENSSRIRTMKVVVGRRSEGTLQRILGSSTPQLEILHVRAFREAGLTAVTRSFPLSEGGPLRELVLDSTSVSNWHSWRISGLRLLDLSYPTITPPLSLILRILSTSPELEQLKLCSFNSPTSLPTVPWDESIVKGQIELPHLKRIHLEVLPPLYCFSILSCIRPGVCNSVRVVDNGTVSEIMALKEELWRERSDTMVALLQLSKVSAPTQAEDCSLSIVMRPLSVTILNVPQMGIHGEPDRSIISFSHANAHHATEVLGEFVSALNLESPPLRLQLDDAAVWRDRSLDLRLWSSSLKILEIQGGPLVRAVYPQLGQQWVSSDGTMTWLCPRLSFIYLSYKGNGFIEDEELDGRPLLDAVQKRWSGQHDMPAALQPARFRISSGGQWLESIRSREEAIKLIVPSFEMY